MMRHSVDSTTDTNRQKCHARHVPLNANGNRKYTVTGRMLGHGTKDSHERCHSIVSSGSQLLTASSRQFLAAGFVRILMLMPTRPKSHFVGKQENHRLLCFELLTALRSCRSELSDIDNIRSESSDVLLWDFLREAAIFH